MKIYSVISILIIVISISCRSGNNKDISSTGEGSGKAVIHFPELTHDFGEITEGEKVACLFRFENNGDGNLIINSVTTSCGCTVPEFSSEPVPPGGSGTVEVIFDSSNRSGLQTKTVHVRSNAEMPVVILKITAEIITN